MCCSNLGFCSGNYYNNSKNSHKKSCNNKCYCKGCYNDYNKGYSNDYDKGYCNDYNKGCSKDFYKGYSDDYSGYKKDDYDKSRYCWDPCEMKVRKAYWAGYRAGYRDGYQVGCYDAPFCCRMNEMYDEL